MSQLASFEHPLQFAGIRDSDIPFPGVFIRAPIIHHVFPSDSRRTPFDILATVPSNLLPQPSSGNTQLGPDAHMVAIRQGNILATSFHPELSQDTRVHEYFLTEIVLPHVLPA